MKRKVVACAVLACVLAPAAFAGCAGGSVDASTQAGASPDAAPVMPVNHSSALSMLWAHPVAMGAMARAITPTPCLPVRWRCLQTTIKMAMSTVEASMGVICCAIRAMWLPMAANSTNRGAPW